MGQHFEKFVSSQVTDGRSGSTSEVIREGLRLLEVREVKLAALRRALLDGEKSGISEYSIAQITRELDQEHSPLKQNEWRDEANFIAKAGKAYFDHIPHKEGRRQRTPGRFKGQIRIADDFDDN